MTKPWCLRLPTGMRDTIDRLAASDQRTRASMTRKLLAEALSSRVNH
jgi:hypothetical protein